jgi:hypothetical protein
MRTRLDVALACVFALLLTAVVFATTPVTTNNAGFDFDGVFYAAMAGSPGTMPGMAHVAPWCYRIVTPFIVSLLPWETLTGFRIVAFASNVVSLVTLFLILRRLGFTGGLSLFGVALYAGVFWTLKFSFYSPAYIDPETQLFLLAIIYLTIDRRYIALVPVLILAALQKESLAAFSVFSATALARERGGHLSMSSSLLAFTMIAAPLGAIGLARAVVPAANTYSGVQEILGQLQLAASAGFWPMFVQSMFSGAGLLPVVVIARPGPWLKFLRERYEWIAYLAISMALLFAGRDKSRLFLYLLPVVIVCSVIVAEELRIRSGVPRAMVWIAVLLLLHLYIGGYLTPMGSFEDYLARMVPEHSDGRYLPYLARNLVLAAGLLIFTLARARP